MLAILAAGRDGALLDAGLEGASAHVEGLGGRAGAGRDVEVEDVHGQAERGARVGDVHDAGHVALDGRAGEEQVDLVVRVAEASEVLDGSCCSAV